MATRRWLVLSAGTGAAGVTALVFGALRLGYQGPSSSDRRSATPLLGRSPRGLRHTGCWTWQIQTARPAQIESSLKGIFLTGNLSRPGSAVALSALLVLLLATALSGCGNTTDASQATASVAPSSATSPRSNSQQASSSHEFHFVIETCGRLSPEQQALGNTAAPYGAVIRVTNLSSTIQGVDPSVAFKVGKRYVSNAPGESKNIAPGHSHLFVIDAISNGHSYIPASSCRLSSYAYGSPKRVGYWSVVLVNQSTH